MLDRWYYSNSFRPTDLVVNWTIDNIPKKDPNAKFTKKNKDPNKYVKIGEIDYIELSFREAVSNSSLMSQGYVKCDCSGKCSNKRCGCVANNIPCNTKCHPKTVSKCLNLHLDE